MFDGKGIPNSYGDPGGRRLRRVTGTDHPRDRGASPASPLVHRIPEIAGAHPGRPLASSAKRALEGRNGLYLACGRCRPTYRPSKTIACLGRPRGNLE